ncbi:hypothetical protein GCM10009793_04720 [Brachybacterium phenoliresistens]
MRQTSTRAGRPISRSGSSGVAVPQAVRWAAKTRAMAAALRAHGLDHIPITAYASDGVTVVGTWTGMSL